MKSLSIYFLFLPFILFANVKTGLDVYFEEGLYKELKGKNIGILTNHTGIDKNMKSTIDNFKEHALDYKISAIFSPEHGIDGKEHAFESISDTKDKDKIPIYSLHGKTRRPTKAMLKNIDTMVYDIQCIGTRSYTYIATLCYMMEEAAKNKIQVVVLDRPNPINGLIVDGPMLDEKFRSFIGYINVPYCHGMTIGELASFFNKEYKIGCDLKVVAMKGWKRKMSFKDTGLHWIPPSPHIPEADTPIYYPSTGILGELKVLNIGVGYTMPFKIVGAPWIDAELFALKLNEQKLPGVIFKPFHFKPFYGLYKNENCHGAMIVITDYDQYRPLAVQYLILGMLKSIYPKEFLKRLDSNASSKELFCKANGTDEIYNILKNERYAAWKMIEFQKKEREDFLKIRKNYLISDYEN